MSGDMRFSQAVSMGLGTLEFLVGMVVVLLLIGAMPDPMTAVQAMRFTLLVVALTIVPVLLTYIAMASERIWISRACLLGLVAIVCLWTGFLYG